MQLRRATPADKPFVTAVATAIKPTDYLPMIYDDLIALAPPDGLYVAELDGRIVGCHAEEWPAPGEVYFYGMRIHPEVQGQGVGSAYCRAQVEGAVANGARHLWLTSKVTNLPAHRTVQKSGFVNRGEWVIYDEIKGLKVAAEGNRARAARPEDRPLVEAFRRELAGLEMADVVGSPTFWYTVLSMRDDDWATEHLAVVAGEGRLDGVMAWRFAEGSLYVRRLEGTPEAAADLLAYGAAQAAAAGVDKWSLSLPARCGHLLAPLNLPVEEVYRAFVFHLSV